MGIDQVQAAMWAGHTKPSMTQDTYGHVLIDSGDDEWNEFWKGVYVRGREARVRSEQPEKGREPA